jgi:hypothetical protein
MAECLEELPLELVQRLRFHTIPLKTCDII